MGQVFNAHHDADIEKGNYNSDVLVEITNQEWAGKYKLNTEPLPG